MWGALGTQPGKRLAGRADGVNPHCATPPDPLWEWPGLEGYFVWPAGPVWGHGSCAAGGSWARGCGVGGQRPYVFHPLPPGTSLLSVSLSLPPPRCASGRGQRVSTLANDTICHSLCCQRSGKPHLSASPLALWPRAPPGLMAFVSSGSRPFLLASPLTSSLPGAHLQSH